MSASSEACSGLGIGMPDDTMYASPIVSTWTVQQGRYNAADVLTVYGLSK